LLVCTYGCLESALVRKKYILFCEPRIGN
jgi:hypothetical protein